MNKDLVCLKRGKMSIEEMKTYLSMCLKGKESIQSRKEMLARKQVEFRKRLVELEESISYIDWKQNFFDDVLPGRREYVSN